MSGARDGKPVSNVGFKMGTDNGIREIGIPPNRGNREKE